MPVIDVLGADGSISKHFPGYEVREQQVRMATAIEKAMTEGGRLLIEAGTGVGKSFAYLVPAVQKCLETGLRCVISTHTINLQSQLIHKDIPALRKILGVGFKAELCMGRQNYLGLRRFNSAMRDIDGDPFSDRAEIMNAIKDSANSGHGTRSELGDIPGQVWQDVLSDRNDCRKEACKHFAKCFWFSHKRRAEDALILVTNHHLLMADLLNRAKTGNGILPDYKYVVIDEGHTLDEVACSTFGVTLDERELRWTLDRICSQDEQHGVVSHGFVSRSGMGGAAQALVAKARAECDVFFADVYSFAKRSEDRRIKPNQFKDCKLVGILNDLGQELADMSDRVGDEDKSSALQKLATQATEASENGAKIILADNLQCVYFAEEMGERRARLCARPVYSGGILKKFLWSNVDTAVVTSATLSVNKRFDYMVRALGLWEGTAIRLGTVFDYKAQAKFYAPCDSPEPTALDYDDRLARMVERFVSETDGGAFVLFTSKKTMLAVADRTSRKFASLGMDIFIHGDSLSREQMVTSFKKSNRAVLYGLDSFWAGVDIPGNALRNVIITKIPFLVPKDPIVMARSEAIEASGRNSFMDYQLSEAILHLKQGIGRLIRTKSDRGIVAILDSRIHTKRYGGIVLGSLPDCDIDKRPAMK